MTFTTTEGRRAARPCRRHQHGSIAPLPVIVVLVVFCLGVVLLPFRGSQAFVPYPSSSSWKATTTTTSSGSFTAALVPSTTTMLLFAHHHHQFNGGYDASKASVVMWNPMQAAEFLIYHTGDPQSAGQQLQPLIQHWTGTNVGEFLTRLYLGEIVVDAAAAATAAAAPAPDKLTFESRNVRTPQWKGLADDQGRQALKDLLRVALPDQVLEPPEIARFAETFLLKEHTWPATTAAISSSSSSTTTSTNQTTATSTTTTATTPTLEKDSFASLGHTAEIAKLFAALRMERHGALFTADDVLSMVLLPEHNAQEQSVLFLQMHDFFWHIGIRLTASEKIDIVQGMAQSGWGPANIAKFVSNIQEVQEHEKISFQPTSTMREPAAADDDDYDATKQSLGLSASSAQEEEEEEEDDDDNDDDNEMVPSYFGGGTTQEYLSTTSATSGNHNNKNELKRRWTESGYTPIPQFTDESWWPENNTPTTLP